MIASAVGGATLALFTSTAGSQENDFATGSVEISQADASTWDLNVGDMAPGDSYEKTITVSNTGSLDLGFASTISRSGALFQGSTPAIVELLNGYGTLSPGDTQDVTVRVSLPLGANRLPDAERQRDGDLPRLPDQESDE